ncbi:unnamed protein product [Vitrella brassicaformis CCMP3155]|uniref:Uncharacterized protein n=1 Tax=Vitrella brassicaformis (strain CCMP3155) TaxID=1169540 RepID=A0A0G4FX70_VITBC|nr:unnamed protein product [Vitrella brassicaformis CCMP3155]|eukprot:CEM19437.1 unnamed protein product [Vitrella brassicaformis CCMP3155]
MKILCVLAVLAVVASAEEPPHLRKLQENETSVFQDIQGRVDQLFCQSKEDCEENQHCVKVLGEVGLDDTVNRGICRTESEACVCTGNYTCVEWFALGTIRSNVCRKLCPEEDQDVCDCAEGEDCVERAAGISLLGDIFDKCTCHKRKGADDCDAEEGCADGEACVGSGSCVGLFVPDEE